MLFRFCKLCCKNTNSSFVRFPRHYAKAAVNARNTRARKKKVQLHDDELLESFKGKMKIIDCRRKVYDFYEGQTYSRKQIIPLASHGWNHRKSKGDYFTIYPYFDGDKDNANEEPIAKTFDDFNLAPALYNQLERFDIKAPLEVQQLGIPKVLSGNHTLLTAETGSGKTLAYLWPLMTQILRWKEVRKNSMNNPFVLILTPTRELAVQIGIEAIKWCKPLGITIKMITGGRTKLKILNPPVNNIDILVGSFGAISKLFTVGVYRKDLIRCVVLDEVDALFHETFEEKLKVLLRRLPIGYHQESIDGFPNTVQLVLASATVPSRMENVLGDIININSLDHVTTGKLHKILVPQRFFRTIPSQKSVELLKYIKPKVAKKKSVIVFSNSTNTSYWLKLFLEECGVPTTNLHGDMSMRQRIGKYGEFLNGRTYVLSTTNAGSRGLNTVMVNHILNFDFPWDTASYIHRCGRTGRVGTYGDCKVTNFISRPKEIILTQKIEWAARKMKPIPIIDLDASKKAQMQDMKEFEEEIEDIPPDPEIENLDHVKDIPF
nr:probable ATP-dependent RNA helicase DDX28 [Megalopta genalis]